MKKATYASKRRQAVRSGKLPALTGLAKPQPRGRALAYRVWVHSKKSGDDYFYEYDDLKEARNFKKRAIASNKFNKVESPIGLFKKKRKYVEARLK